MGWGAAGLGVLLVVLGYGAGQPLRLPGTMMCAVGVTLVAPPTSEPEPPSTAPKPPPESEETAKPAPQPLPTARPPPPKPTPTATVSPTPPPDEDHDRCLDYINIPWLFDLCLLRR